MGLLMIDMSKAVVLSYDEVKKIVSAIQFMGFTRVDNIKKLQENDLLDPVCNLVSIAREIEEMDNAETH